MFVIKILLVSISTGLYDGQEEIYRSKHRRNYDLGIRELTRLMRYLYLFLASEPRRYVVITIGHLHSVNVIADGGS